MAPGRRIGRRTFLAATMASLAAPAVIRVARGDAPQFTLKLHHALSSVSGGHEKFLAPWARRVETQSAGRIRIDIFPSMQLGGQPAQLFEQARNGIADIVWAAPSATPGRFPKIELFELPFVPSRRALVNSRAVEDFAGENLKDEFRDVHPICFACADRSVLHTSHPVQTMTDLKGLKLHVQTRFAGEAVQVLGARAVPMPSAQLPMAISRHVVDGCLDPWDMVPALKLGDLLKAHTDFAESSLSTTTFVLAMNKATYDRLPAALKTVINNNSGQLATGMIGTVWDLQAAAVADLVTQRGDHIITLMPEAVAHWRQATESVVDAWRKQMRERKVDGDKLLASARLLLEKYASEPEPQPTQPAQPPEAKADVNPPPKTNPPPNTTSTAPPARAPMAPQAPPSTMASTPPVAAPTPQAPSNVTSAAPPVAGPTHPAPSNVTSATPPVAAPTPQALPAPAAAAPAPVMKPAPAAASPPAALDIPL